MLDELNAIVENQGVVKPGGFLKMGKDSGGIVVLAKEDAVC